MQKATPFSVTVQEEKTIVISETLAVFVNRTLGPTPPIDPARRTKNTSGVLVVAAIHINKAGTTSNMGNRTRCNQEVSHISGDYHVTATTPFA